MIIEDEINELKTRLYFELTRTLVTNYDTLEFAVANYAVLPGELSSEIRKEYIKKIDKAVNLVIAMRAFVSSLPKDEEMLNLTIKKAHLMVLEVFIKNYGE